MRSYQQKMLHCFLQTSYGHRKKPFRPQIVPQWFYNITILEGSSYPQHTNECPPAFLSQPS